MTKVPMSDRLRELNRLGSFALVVNDTVNAALAEKFSQTRSELETLVSVRYCDTFTIGWLSGVLNLSHSAAVRIADRLEKDGLLRRIKLDNRRFVGLILTQTGVERADKINDARIDALQSLFQDCDDQEIDRISSIVQKILGKTSEDKHTSYRRCRLCSEVICGPTCPVLATFGPRG